MRSVGIIAEYNPFHLGHKYHIQEARKKSGADTVVVVMSQCFTQRGDAAIFSPYARAQMALENGADIVFAMPVLYSCRDGGNFALGGVKLLNMLGVDCISFGAECDDIALIWKTAELLENEESSLKAHFKHNSQSGKPYPASIAAALEKVNPDSGKILTCPNNILAVCYLRAMIKTCSKMTPFPIQRKGAGYSSTNLEEEMPSASAVRSAILSGNYGALCRAMPKSCVKIAEEEIRAGRIVRPEALDSATVYRLRTMGSEEYSQLPDVSEGIENRLRKCAMQFSSREEIIQAVKTRRYTYGRISRMCTHALLHITAEDCVNTNDCRPVLLGFRNTASEFLRELKKKNVASQRCVDAAQQSSTARADMRAWDVWSCGCRQPGGMGYTGKTIHIL